MKQLFFTLVAIAVPGVIFSWLVWVFLKGVYTVVGDFRLNRELRRIRAEAAHRPRPDPSAGATGKVKEETDPAATAPVVSFPMDEPASAASPNASDTTAAAPAPNSEVSFDLKTDDVEPPPGPERTNG